MSPNCDCAHCKHLIENPVPPCYCDHCQSLRHKRTLIQQFGEFIKRGYGVSDPKGLRNG